MSGGDYIAIWLRVLLITVVVILSAVALWLLLRPWPPMPEAKDRKERQPNGC